MPTCPNGLTTVAADYCDICGEPLPAASGVGVDAGTAVPPAAASGTPEAPMDPAAAASKP